MSPVRTIRRTKGVAWPGGPRVRWGADRASGPDLRRKRRPVGVHGRDAAPACYGPGIRGSPHRSDETDRPVDQERAAREGAEIDGRDETSPGRASRPTTSISSGPQRSRLSTRWSRTRSTGTCRASTATTTTRPTPLSTAGRSTSTTARRRSWEWPRRPNFGTGNFRSGIVTITSIPDPSSAVMVALVGLSALGLAGLRRFRHRSLGLRPWDPSRPRRPIQTAFTGPDKKGDRLGACPVSCLSARGGPGERPGAVSAGCGAGW